MSHDPLFETPSSPLPNWMTEENELAQVLVKDSDLKFFARDLGFPEHTMIREAVKPILAKHIAHYVRAYAIHYMETYCGYKRPGINGQE